MKRQIRNKVFETNSSSVHSLIISDTGMEDPNLKLIEKDSGKYVCVELNCFDNSEKTYTSQEDKLSYILTLMYILNGEYDNEYAFYDLENKIIDYYKKRKGVNINGIIITNADKAAIDHQTVNKYYYGTFSDYEFMQNMGVDFMNFIFNKYISLHTDSD